MKATYSQIQSLTGVFSKLIVAEFDSYDEAKVHADNSVHLEDSLRAFEKLKDSIIKKYKVSDGASEKDLEKANQEFSKLLLTETTVNVSKVSKDSLSKIKITPIEIMALLELDLVEEK